jgi:hypothetical protein
MKKKHLLQRLLLFFFFFFFEIASAQTAIFNSSMAITPYGSVNSPGGEMFGNIIDNNINTKFLDFTSYDGMAFTVFLGSNAKIASSITITTANDVPGRDPKNYEIFGSNDGSSFTSIATGDIGFITSRQFTRKYYFLNSNAYKYYRVNFTNTWEPVGMMQLAEVQLYTCEVATSGSISTNQTISGAISFTPAGEANINSGSSAQISPEIYDYQCVGQFVENCYWDGEKEVCEQYWDDCYDYVNNFTPPHTAAQSFMTSSNVNLSAIKINVASIINTGTYTLRIFQGASDSSTELTNQSVSIFNSGTNTFLLNTTLALTGGQPYTFKLESRDGYAKFNWTYSSDSDYSNGAGYVDGNNNNGDFNFQLVYQNNVNWQNLTLSNYTGGVQKWQMSTNPSFPSPVDIASTSATLASYLIGNISQTTYFRAVVIGCSSIFSDYVTISVDPSITQSTWTGTNSTAWSDAANWSNSSIPLLSSNVIIAAAVNQPVLATNVAINSLTIDSGATLTVSSAKNLTVADYIDNSGILTLENNANLIQTAATNTNSGAGTATVKRDSNSLKRLDYTMWSSPVTGSQTLLQFSPLTSAATPVRFYTYNPATNVYSAATVTSPFATGTGYLIRMPNEKPGSLGLTTDYYKGLEAITYNGVFTGTLNNGTVTVTTVANKYYSVGNPYPSTISANSFLSGNATAGTLYFWRKTNGAGGTAYATYTASLGGAAGASGTTPNGTIQVGQGFLVKASSTSLSFTNAMRETAPTSTQFLKTKKVADKSRLWLDLSDATGRMNQVLVGYLDGATLGFDAGIDGKYFNDSKIALTSIVDAEEYVIQGRPTFDATDVVALGFKTDVAGDYTIALNSFDGVFESGQDIYLVDAVAGKEIDLKTGSYNFTATAGVDNARFSLKYQKTLKVDAPAFNENSVKVYKNNGAIVVNSASKAIKTIEVYDVQGRLLAQQKNVNATTATISNLKTLRQVLIVKISADDNSVVSKKVLN